MKMSPNKALGSRRKHYHQSPKAGCIYCDSSYELKAALLLDEDDDVMFYESQLPFQGKEHKRRMDFFVHLKDGSKKMVEVKPEKRISQFQEQINDNEVHAKENGYGFEIWTERELGFSSEYFATKWADEYLSKIKPVDFVAIRKNGNRKKSKKYYHKKHANEKTQFHCKYCNAEHEVLALTYDRNTKKNGRFICHQENAEKPKPSKNKKVNPFAAEGKKQCNRCEEVKLFETFGEDKSKSDGFATRCKKCRAEVATERYQRRIK